METVPQSWKRRGNGRETNGKRAGEKGALGPAPASGETGRERDREGW